MYLAHLMLAWAGNIPVIDADHRNDWQFDSAQKDVINLRAYVCRSAYNSICGQKPAKA